VEFFILYNNARWKTFNVKSRCIEDDKNYKFHLTITILMTLYATDREKQAGLLLMDRDSILSLLNFSPFITIFLSYC
jgi:hypothetical protein